MATSADFEKLLRFESGDIPYNRRGELSPRQRQAMRSDSRGCLIRLLSAVAASIVLLIIGFFLIKGEAGECVGGIGITGLFLTVPFLIITLMPTPKTAYQVLTADGTAQHNMGYSKGTNKYYMVVINGVDFRVGLDVYDKFEEGARYLVYYTRSGSTNSIVSMEQWV